MVIGFVLGRVRFVGAAVGFVWAWGVGFGGGMEPGCGTLRTQGLFWEV